MQVSDNYNSIIKKAFHRHYTESSDVWTNDIGMRTLPLLIQGKLRLSRKERILDIGCGSGLDSHIYSPLSSGFTGVDIYAHSEWKEIETKYNNVTFYQNDFLSCPLDGHYDIIVDNGCLHHQTNDTFSSYLNKIYKHLSSDGYLVLSTFYDNTKQTYTDNYKRIHHYFSDEQLTSLLNKTGFSIVETMYIYRPTYDNYYQISFCQKV